MEEVEQIYTNKLESGNRTRAMQRLRVPPLEEKQPRIVTFRLGFSMGESFASFPMQASLCLFVRWLTTGMLCLLIPLTIVLGFVLKESANGTDLAWRPALRLSRSIFLIMLHVCLVACNIYGWSRYGVNHVLIFEFDPRSHLTYQRLAEIGTFLLILWFLSFVSFMITFYYNYQPFVQPIILLALVLIFLLNPVRVCYHQARFWLLKKLGQVFLSPFYHVDFANFWLADQLLSLDLCFYDLEYFICYYINDVQWTTEVKDSSQTRTAMCYGWSQYVFQTVLILIPSWIRLAQCLRRYYDTRQKFPHLVNASKYATGFLVAISNALRRSTTAQYENGRAANPFLYVWIVASLFSSTFRLIWDLKMDWGFFDANAGDNRFLREQIIYSSKTLYYVVIVGNVFLRYVWMVNICLYLYSSTDEYADMIGFGFGLAEVFRRFVWNYFRVENEHLNNCGEFRAVRDISFQMTSTAATGYSAHLHKINKKSEVKQFRHAKRRHSSVVDEKLRLSQSSTDVTVSPVEEITQHHVAFSVARPTRTKQKSRPANVHIKALLQDVSTVNETKKRRK